MRRIFCFLPALAAGVLLTLLPTLPDAQELPGEDPALTEFLQQLERQHRLEDERHELTQQIRAQPRNTSALFQRAEINIQLGKGEAAVADVQLATSINDDVDSLAKAAMILSGYSPEKGIEIIDKALQKSPRDAELLSKRGYIHNLAGNQEAALADFDASLAITPLQPEVRAIKGGVLLQRGEYEAAIQSFTKAIAISPHSQIFYDRGYCFKETGNFTAAIADYTEAIRLDTKNAGAVCERGQAHQLAGNYKRAIEDYEQCLEDVPDGAQPQLQLSWLLATCPDEEVRDGNRALQIASEIFDPKTCRFPEPLSALAAAYAELGNYFEAERLQRRALALAVLNPEARNDYARWLRAIQSRRPVRDGSTPLQFRERGSSGQLPPLSVEDALSLPADVLGAMYLEAVNFQQMATIGAGGGTVNISIPGKEIQINQSNASSLLQDIEQRQAVYRQAIHRRGSRLLSEAYTSETSGDCDGWALEDKPVLVAQEAFSVELTQGMTQHFGVVVESTVVFRHDLAIQFMIAGEIAKDGSITFLTPKRPGVRGTANDRCVLTLKPAKLKGDDIVNAMVDRAIAYQRTQRYDDSLKDLETALQISPRPESAALKAILLATCEDKDFRDARKAIKAAVLARQLTRDEDNFLTLTALVVAYAEAGDFTKAIAFQRQLIDLLPSDQREPAIEDLRVLEGGKPFHDALAQ